jgi:hypothetical protein
VAAVVAFEGRCQEESMMRRFAGVCVAVVLAIGSGVWAQDKPKTDANTLNFADFEEVEKGRPVSTRGGLVQLFSYEEDKALKAEFKGAPGVEPAAPELVHIKAGDPNHAAKFDFLLHAPNQWTGVTLEIHGLPDQDGKPAPDDLSGYKTLSLQAYATGVEILRLEALSKQRGKDTTFAWPMDTFRVRPGFNTYKVPLKAFSQPAWAPVRVDPKEIFKELTSINLTAFCDQCKLNQQGMVIIDNIVFEK